MSFLLRPLEFIACIIEKLAGSIPGLLIIALNAVIEGLAAILVALAALLPGMPVLPALPDPVADAVGWASWVFPVGTLGEIFAWLVVAFVVWQGVVLVMRWAKATNQ